LRAARGRAAALSVLLALAVTGCAASWAPGRAVLPDGIERAGTAPGRYVKHVVIIVQENRSFVDLFRGFPGADAPSFGYAGNRRIVLKPVPLEDPNNIENNWSDAVTSWDNGKMDGFSHEHFYGTKDTFPYAYVPAAESHPYWELARRWVLADRMFPTEFGPSFTAHLNLIAANTELNPHEIEVDAPAALPWGCDAPPGTRTYVLAAGSESLGPFPCFKPLRTMADTLDAAGISWRYYAPLLKASLGGEAWTEFDAIREVRYGPDWKNVVSPETTVLADVKNGRLPGVSWVIPDMQNSDHAGSGSNTGPAWVASVINAIGRSRYWNSTAIVVLWDDWGGWYDDAVPPQLDERGLAIRVPCMVISPYARIARGAKAGLVSHTQYEFASVLKFVEQVYGLPTLGPASLGYTDSRANSILDIFDFSQKPRPFVAVPQPYSDTYLLTRPPSLQPPDEQ
jgi:phospholipase C